MKAHTSNFKDEIKLLGRQIDSKITYISGSEEIELGAEELNSVTPHYEANILKSVMKQLDIESAIEIPVGTELNYKFGLLVNEEYEYIDFGNYIVYSVEKQEDTKSWKIVCYDKMLYSMKPYEGLGVEYPVTVKEYLTALCNKIGLTLATSTFVNDDTEIQRELYLDIDGNSLGYTYRDILDQLAGATASTICINDDDEIEVRYITDTEDTIDEEYLKDIHVNFGEKYGPINSVVFSRSEESDNIYRKDDESIEENGLHEIRIADNEILNFNNRDEYIDEVFEQLNGLEYYANDFTSTGIGYYNVCDEYNITVGDNTYPCVMLNDEFKVTQGLVEEIHTETPEDEVTDYTKADKTDRRINQTYLIVDKQEGTITALASRTEDLESEVGNMYTVEQINTLIQNAENGVTNTFAEAGGNNIFRNTGLWFSAQSTEQSLIPSTSTYPSEETFAGRTVTYEYWNGSLKKGQEDKASNGIAILLQDDICYQEQKVANGKYTVSFKYKRLVPLATATVKINDNTYTLGEEDYQEFEQTIEVTSQHISVTFTCSVANGMEIFDLMVNAGSVKLAYSQNQNETTTDTVNISKGITITSTDTDTTFKANADGIRTLDRNGNELTKFTDIGMIAKKVIVQEESQIVGTLWQEVGEQTWITRL